MSYYILAEETSTKTLIDFLSLVVAGLALLIALLGYRLARKGDERSAENEKETAQLKKSEFRRELRDKLRELAFLVTQRSIVISQTQSAYQEMLRTLSTVSPSLLQRDEFKDLRASYAEASEVAAKDAQSNKEAEDVLTEVWDLETISQEIFDKVQRYCSFAETALEKQRSSLAAILKQNERLMAAIQAVSAPPK